MSSALLLSCIIVNGALSARPGPTTVTLDPSSIRGYDRDKSFALRPDKPS